MREILFRGKRESDNKWIYGYLSDCNEISNINTVDMSREEVDDDTIGQWTGFMDENRTYIFEGDVLQYKYSIDDFEKPGTYRSVVTFKNGIFCLDNDEEMSLSYIFWKTDDELNVLGNIYDNPELMKLCRANKSK